MKEAFFREWLNYFQWNSEEPDTLPWDARETLTPLERMRIAKSIAASLSVLITAELIALIYYRALREATGSRLLRAMCNKILDDEKAHVEYESALIRFAQERSGWRMRIWRSGQRMLFAATLRVVYREHRFVLRAGGHPWPRFRSACWREFRRAFPEKSSGIAFRDGREVEAMRRAT